MASNRAAEFVRRLSQPDPDALRRIRNPDDITARILRAAFEQFELVGIRRSTMEDVARRCGVGRATLYRRFPTKESLVDTLVLAEALRYLEGSAAARAAGETLEDRLLHGTVFAVTFLRDHGLLERLLRTEPETILPSLTIEAGDILDFAIEHATNELRGDLYGSAATTPEQEQHLRTVAELHTRLTLSFIVTPHTGIKLATMEEARTYVQRYLLPMLTTPI